LIGSDNTECEGKIYPFTFESGFSNLTYYKVLAKFVTENSELSLLKMRFFNSFLMSLLLGILTFVSPSTTSKKIIVGLLLTLIPHGLFAVSSVNPSSWSYIGVTFSWAFLYSTLGKQASRFRTVLGIFGLIISIFVSLSTRLDTIYYLVLTSVIVIIGSHQLDFSKFKRISIAFLFLLLVFYRGLDNNQIYIRYIQFLDSPITLSNLLSLGNAVKVAIATPLRLAGLQPVGWLDSSTSNLALLVGVSIIGLVIFFDSNKRSKEQLDFVLLTVAFYFLTILIAVLLYPEWTSPFYLIRTGWSGDYFQPRYFLPMMPFVYSVFFLSSEQDSFDQKSFRFSLVLLFATCHALSLYSSSNLLRRNPSWWWSEIYISQTQNLTIGSFSFLVFLITLFGNSQKENDLVSICNKRGI
jgi:hypothetical protein